jgi:hypothetical protein
VAEIIPDPNPLMIIPFVVMLVAMELFRFNLTQ